MSTIRCDVLVIGAGPAGSAAALLVARQGLSTVVADRAGFPRDKVCGDALAPDALKALARLGLLEKVMAHAVPFSRLRAYAPNGKWVDLHGTFAVVPRLILDALLVREAVAVGARLLQGHKLVDVVVSRGRVSGGRLQDLATGALVTVECRLVIVATGANARVLELSELSDDHRSQAIAARTYFEVDQETSDAVNYLSVSYDSSICPGYGWVFPGPNRVFNVGVGLFADSPSRLRDVSITDVWKQFVTRFDPAAAIVARGRQLRPLKGSPLRTDFLKSKVHRPGLIAIGEAAGLTYPLTGEGIGKALESAVIAADAVAVQRAHDNLDNVDREYGERVRREFARRFRAYDIAQRWMRRPLILNFLNSRARRGTYVRAELEALLAESADPLRLFSVSGLVRAALR